AIARITASITAYSAMSCPSSFLISSLSMGVLLKAPVLVFFLDLAFPAVLVLVAFLYPQGHVALALVVVDHLREPADAAVVRHDPDVGEDVQSEHRQQPDARPAQHGAERVPREQDGCQHRAPEIHEDDEQGEQGVLPRACPDASDHDLHSLPPRRTASENRL